MKKIIITIIISSMILLFLISFDMRYGHLDEIILSMEAADIPITWVDIATDIELDNEITASGNIRISRCRDDPNRMSGISFYPYPGYFHLFPFIDRYDVLRFSIENSGEELLSLLGIDQDDVPRDDRGWWSLDNVTAVFDSFIKLEFMFGTVISGNINHFVDNWDGDLWEIEELDFILITNGNETIEPIVLQAGDEFMGFHLSEIRSSQMFLRNSEIYRQLSASAKVSGQLTLLGDLTLEFYNPSVSQSVATFTVSGESLPMLPQIADFRKVPNSFFLDNLSEVMRALGVTRRELRAARIIEFTDVTMILDFTRICSSGYQARFIAFPTDQ